MNNIYKKLSVILMFLSMVMCFGISVSIVNGTLWGASSAAAPCPDCNSGYGTSGGTGQLVIATGYRVSILDSSGKLISGTNSVDYWPKNDEHEHEGYCYRGFKYFTEDCNKTAYTRAYGRTLQYYKNKYPKTQVSTLDKLSDITTNSQAIGKYNQYDFILSNSKTYNYTDSCGSDYWSSKDKAWIANGGIWTCRKGAGAGDTRYNNNYTNYVLLELSPIVEGTNGNHTDYDYQIVGKLLQYGGYKKNLKNYRDVVSSAVKDNVFLSVEPVTALARDLKVYIGTPAELSNMGYTSSGTLAWSYPRYSYLHPVVYAQSDKKEIVAGIETCPSLNTLKDSNHVNALNPKNCLGIFLFNLSENFPPSNCADLTTEYIEEIKYDKDSFINGIQNKLGDKYNNNNSWLKNFYDYGFNLSTLKSYLEDPDNENCPRPNCDFVAEKKKNDPNVGTILLKYSDYTSSVMNASKKRDTITSLDAYRSNLLKVGSSVSCGTITCTSLLSENGKSETYLKKLYDKFSDFNFLNKEFLDELGLSLNDAKCEPAPTCPVEIETASCQTSGDSTFTLSDTNLTDDLKKKVEDQCLKNGIAYNALNIRNNNNEIIKVEEHQTQTSYDSTYGKNAYCWESVTFNFPTTNGESYDVISGELLKWGMNTEKKNALFGTMTVKRICYPTTDGTSIDITWAKDRINPKISIYYKPAIPEDAQADSKKVKQFTVNGKTLDVQLDKYVVSGQDARNLSNYSCGGSCKGKKIEMEATYNLNYGTSLKWYASTSQSISDDKEIINYEDNKDKIDNKNASYSWLGYGLPTTLLTPTNISTTMEVYGKYNWNSVSNGSTSGRGTLHATVENIGTKNKNNGNYHFDKLVKFAINDDNYDNNDKIYYNCPYRVKNDLFDTESGDGDDFKTPKGIDVVFRTIDLMDNSTDEELDRAFPGMSGTGRTMGANWNKIYNDGADNGARKILNILSSSIYGEKRDPMYHITLDVGTIQNIRTYNRNARSINIGGDKFDPYTSMPIYDSTESSEGKGYLGYICKRVGTVDESTYRYCASNFLTKLRDDGYLTGSCMENTGNTSDRADKYKESGCNQEWWNEE